MEKKKIMLIALFSLLAVGIATASLLQYFGQVKTTANVEQSVVLLEEDEHTIPELSPDGEQFCYLQKLQNRASVDISVWLNASCSYDGVGENSCDEIGTNFYAVKDERTLMLCAKDPATWQCKGQGATATLTFDPVSPTFDYELVAMNLAGNTEYKLIYYADSGATSPTGKPWNMNNAVLIGTGTSDGDGNLGMSNSADLGINLPESTDYNAIPNAGDSYCNGENGYDDYEHCSGAKIWLITGAISNSNWNPTAWLFEEDLIVYSDCNLDSMGYVVDMELKQDELGDNAKLTTESRAITPFVVCYDFPFGTYEGEYTLTTNVLTSDPEDEE